jgi:asparagine synthase (glutamine-hydrolysing)
VTNCWGNYVAFVGDPSAHSKRVIKDPTGNLPCFSTRYRDATLFFSCIDDCLRLDLPFTVNHAYLRVRMINGGSNEHPPLKEVLQVNRGECVEIAPQNDSALASRCFYWTPLNFPASGNSI